MKNYDVIIIGGGPAGIFAALELCQTAGRKILLIEKGKDIIGRRCPVRDTGSTCVACQPCNLVCGLGGAGAFSDGKLVLSSEVGGHLGEYLGKESAAKLIKYVDELYLKFGASEKVFGGDGAVRGNRPEGRRGRPAPDTDARTPYGHGKLLFRAESHAGLPGAENGIETLLHGRPRLWRIKAWSKVSRPKTAKNIAASILSWRRAGKGPTGYPMRPTDST